MSSNSDLAVRRREISALVDGVAALERELAAKGIDARDSDERMETMDIIRRIERKMMQKMPAQEAAE